MRGRSFAPVASLVIVHTFAILQRLRVPASTFTCHAPETSSCLKTFWGKRTLGQSSSLQSCRPSTRLMPNTKELELSSVRPMLQTVTSGLTCISPPLASELGTGADKDIPFAYALLGRYFIASLTYQLHTPHQPPDQRLFT
jgi:hypothetical protein